MRTGPVPTHCMHMRIPRACGFLALPRTSFLPPVYPTVYHPNGPCGRIIRRSSVLTVACCHGGAEEVRTPHNAAGCAEGGTPPASRVGTVRSDAPCRSMRCRGAMMPLTSLDIVLYGHDGCCDACPRRAMPQRVGTMNAGAVFMTRGAAGWADTRRERGGDACVARWCNMLWRMTSVSRLRRAMVWG